MHWDPPGAACMQKRITHIAPSSHVGLIKFKKLLLLLNPNEMHAGLE
jgi:hypothetical protein